MDRLCHLCIGIKGENLNYRLCTGAKDCCVCIHVNLANPSILPLRIVKASPIWRSLAAVSMTVADFHHSAATTPIISSSACLDGNSGHMAW